MFSKSTSHFANINIQKQSFTMLYCSILKVWEEETSSSKTAAYGSKDEVQKQ